MWSGSSWSSASRRCTSPASRWVPAWGWHSRSRPPPGSDRSHWSTASPASGPRAREAFGGWWRAWRSLARTPRWTYVAALVALATFDARPRLASVRCPTLVVTGDGDATVALEAKEELARRIEGARLVVVPDSGHATPGDQPERFNRIVLEFIGAH
ncbi:MAG: hypothetical protein DME15_09615 [Candidatus Rokuibacteriota bacterium]|nr:MAG: hypothetical protein DME15_09615 [Candidatus Rokubacteria bacterium]